MDIKKILLISEQKVKDLSIIDFNVDSKLLSNIIRGVQDIEVKAILGKKLYEEVLTEIHSSKTVDNYIINPFINELWADYIQPYLVYGTLCQFIILNNAKVTNKGTMKFTDNSASSVSMNELEYFKNHYDNELRIHKKRLIEFLAINNVLDHNADTETDTYATGWLLDSPSRPVIEISSSSNSTSIGGGSTVPVYATLDITGKTEIDLSSVQHANYINLVSSNPTENIYKIKNFGNRYNEVKFLPEKNLAVTFHKTNDNSAPGVDEIEIPTPTFIADGHYYDWFRVEKINTWSRQTDGMTYGVLIGLFPTNWSTTGNTGTNPSINFIGTTDVVGLNFKTNGSNRMYIDAVGNVGINTTSPDAKFHVQGLNEFNYAKLMTNYSNFASGLDIRISDAETSGEFGYFSLRCNPVENWMIEARSPDSQTFSWLQLGKYSVGFTVGDSTFQSLVGLWGDEMGSGIFSINGARLCITDLIGEGTRMAVVDENGYFGTQDIPSSSWGGITGTVTDQTDLISFLDSNFYPLGSNPAGYIMSSGSYSNPSWITSLAWSKITGTPTTLSGYGITDAVTLTTTQTITGTKTFTLINLQPTTSATSGVITQNFNSFIHTYGTDNIFMGNGAGNFTTSSTGRNIGLGFQSLSAVTTGNNNISIGYQAMPNSTTSTQNVAIGTQTLFTINQTGNGNTAIGHQSLYFFQGFSVGTPATQATPNTAIGSFTLANTTIGYGNTAVGSGALFTNTTGGNNAALGYWTLRFNTIGSDNTAFGTTAMRENTEGSNNVALGRLALRFNQTGNTNTVVGAYAGYSSLGSGNVYIGYQAGYYETGSNKLYIANSNVGTPLISGDFSTGNVGINTSTPNISSALDITATDKGLLIPRLTVAQRNAIVTPASSLMIYNTDSATLDSFDGTNWRVLGGKKNDFLLAQQAIGSPIIVEPIYGIKAMNTNLINMVNARLYYMGCYVDRTTTVSGVMWYLAAQGVYTAGSYNGVGLYSYNTSTGTMTLVASSTDDGNIWKGTASTWHQKAFSSPVVIGPGLYFIGALFTSGAITTQPALSSVTVAGQSGAILPTNSAKLFGTGISAGSFPSTQAMSGITVGFAVTLALY